MPPERPNALTDGVVAILLAMHRVAGRARLVPDRRVTRVLESSS